MKELWRLDGYRVIATGLTETTDIGFAGIVTKPSGECLLWEAWPESTGYKVAITHKANGGPLSYWSITQGTTLNLGLEVARAAKHV